MNPISRIQASLASATQETTLALANLNFDFSLYKVEAPASYQPLGSALSPWRRSAAEHGQPHIVARRLGSLFEKLLPETPSLIDAYGTRASEICQSPEFVKLRDDKGYGAFTQFVGLDGTSIWAAATSGPSAVAVHLLACMLARMWSALEAVSIWEELVVARKKILLPDLEEGKIQSVPVQDAIAAQLIITRDQLTEWDASARAWLRAADESSAARQRHKRLMRVSGELSMPIGSHSIVYDSVCEAWVTALATIDKLVQGHPHSAQDGAILLASSAWHLYPDLIILSSTSQEVLQHDPLMAPGAALTMGLLSCSARSAMGVRWSLSLGHLRHYGPPVRKEASLHADSSRLTFPQFLLVVLGAFFYVCNVPTNQIREAAEVVTLMRACVARAVQKRNGYSWLDPLENAASMLLKSLEGTGDESIKLVQLGLRRGTILTTKGSHDDILFHQTANLARFMPSTDDQVEFCLSLFREPKYKAFPVILRVHPSGQQSASFVMAVPDTHGTDTCSHTAYTVFIPEEYPDSWCGKANRKVTFPMRNCVERQTRFGVRTDTIIWEHPPRELSNGAPSADKADSQAGTEIIELDLVFNSTSAVSVFRLRGDAPSTGKPAKFKVPLTTVAAAFQGNQISGEHLYKHLHEGLSVNRHCVEMIKSCEYIAQAARVYQSIPSATVSPLVLARDVPIARLNLAVTYGRKNGLLSTTTIIPGGFQTVSHAVAFQCIAYFESGSDLWRLHADQDGAERCMALSSGDSLYIAAPMICDPAIQLKPYEIRHVLGNIGQGGISFLIPPINPMIRSRAPEDWVLVNHTPFDGKLENNYGATSLHLSFTGYRIPIVPSSQGLRSSEAFIVEAVISVHDSGRWVADIDVGSCLSTSLLHILQKGGPLDTTKKGQGDNESNQSADDNSGQLGPYVCDRATHAGYKPEGPFVSFDNWDELLDPPPPSGDHGVVRARGNWQARLAAVCVSVAKGHPTVLFGAHGCWRCAASLLRDKEFRKERKKADKTTVIII